MSDYGLSTQVQNATITMGPGTDVQANAAASLVVSAAAATFLYAGLASDAAARVWLHVFDAAALPANGTVPTLTPVAVDNTLEGSISLFDRGVAFGTGITLAVSTTHRTLTVSVATTFHLCGIFTT